MLVNSNLTIYTKTNQEIKLNGVQSASKLKNVLKFKLKQNVSK